VTARTLACELDGCQLDDATLNAEHFADLRRKQSDDATARGKAQADMLSLSKFMPTFS
jgi:hypothetical protein